MFIRKKKYRTIDYPGLTYVEKLSIGWDFKGRMGQSDQNAWDSKARKRNYKF